MFSIRTLSLVTGITYISMIPFGIVGILYVPNTLINTQDMGSTLTMIQENISLFHISVLSALIVQLIQIVLVLLMYRLLRHASKTAGVLMIACILPAVSIAMLNEVNYLGISAILRNSDFATYFTPEQQQGLVHLLYEMHRSGVMIAQIFWGLWLFPMGYLAYRSGYIPRIIGIFLMIGCFGYCADSLAYIAGIPIGFTVSEYTFLGEVLLPLWLVFRSGYVSRMHPEQRA